MAREAIDEVWRKLNAIVFRIEFTGTDGKEHRGTGFFIDASGLALTAFHNLPPFVLAEPERSFTGYSGGRVLELVWHLPAEKDRMWQEELDLAVLRVHGLRPDTSVPLLCLAPPASEQARKLEWRGRSVAMVGYPVSQGSQPAFVVGSVSAVAPFEEPEIRTSRRRARPSLAFADDFQSEWTGKDLEGTSGAPIYDRELQCIVAVQFAAWPRRHRAYATELSELSRHWPAFRKLSRVGHRSTLTGGCLRNRRLWRRRGLATASFLAVAVLVDALLPGSTPSIHGLDVHLPYRGVMTPSGAAVAGVQVLPCWPGDEEVRLPRAVWPSAAVVRAGAGAVRGWACARAVLSSGEAASRCRFLWDAAGDTRIGVELPVPGERRDVFVDVELLTRSPLFLRARASRLVHAQCTLITEE